MQQTHGSRGSMARRPDNLKGTNLTAPINRLEPGEVALASNVRAYGDGSFELRTGLSDPIFTVEKPGAGGTKIPQAVISAGAGTPWSDAGDATSKDIGGEVCDITSWAISSADSTATFQSANDLEAGEVVTLTDFDSPSPFGTVLQGVILPGGLSGAQFAINFPSTYDSSMTASGIATGAGAFAQARLLLPPVAVPMGQQVAWTAPSLATSQVDSRGSIEACSVIPGPFTASAFSTPSGGTLQQSGACTLIGFPAPFPKLDWSGFALPVLPGDAAIQNIYAVVFAVGNRTNCAHILEATGAASPGTPPLFSFSAQVATGSMGNTEADITGATVSYTIEQSLSGGPYPDYADIVSVALAVYYTTAETPPADTTLQTLEGTDCDFNIDLGALISGVTVGMVTGNDSGAGSILTAQLTLAGVPVGAPQTFTPGAWPEAIELSGPWGVGLTPAEVNGANGIGVNIFGTLDSSSVVNLNNLAITIDAATGGGAIRSLYRMNDTTPAGPAQGYCLIVATDSGAVYCWNGVDSGPVASGLTGNPVSIVPFRPNASVQPVAYIGDDAPYPNVTVDSGFQCTGMIKVRSDGLSRKMGIEEPQTAPIVSTGTTNIVFMDSSLGANSVPWTNYSGANPDYNYGQTTNPGTGGVGEPFIINLPTGSSSVDLTITGTATVNGAIHGPGDAAPTSSAYPAQFASAGVVVLGAFTDGAGNVLPPPAGSTPLVVPIGAGGTFQVPNGAAQLQVGIDSQNGDFPSNTGDFGISGQIHVSSFASVPSTVGMVTAYVWGDSPHSGPVAAYIWKNPSDGGSGTARSVGSAPVTTTNNSWQINTTPGPSNPTTPPQWDQMTDTGSVSGEIALFPTAFSQSAPNCTNFNACLAGTIFFPAGGMHTLTLAYKDQIMLGIGGGITAGYASGDAAASYSPKGPNGQAISVAGSLPLVFVSAPDGDGGPKSTTLTFSVPAGGGLFAFELDWDYWFHSGCTLALTIDGRPIPPLPSGTRTGVSYAGKYRASESGAQSNPSPASSPSTTPVLNNTVALEYSPDPQVDKVDYYRQDDELPNFTYVGTGPNTDPPTPIIDSLSDLAVANNQEMTFDDFEPVPSIDLPRAGTCNVSGGVITRTSGDLFNVRWLAGTVILIGAPPPFGQPLVPQVAYDLIARPTSSSEMTIPGVPDGENLLWNIAEPILAAQPLAYIWGPTDNINYAFGVGDPLRPGTLYWSKGSNLDSWPDTNQMDVTDPSEPLVNGAMSNGLGVLASIKRFWLIYPNFFNALATVTGTSGSTWTLQATAIDRALFIPRCLAVEGGGSVFFRVDDGIHYSKGGGASVSITDDTLYPLFPHESPGAGSSVPQPVVRNGVTIYPPDDSQPQTQQFSIQNGYLYYDHQGTDGNPHTWVLDIRTLAWVWDIYDGAKPTVHAANEGESQQGTLAGCSDGTVRLMETDAPEQVSGIVLTAGIGGAGWMSAYEATFEYACDSGATVTFLAADEGNGSYAPNPVFLDSTAGQIAKFTTKVSPNKWQLLQMQFESTDKSLQVYTEGTVLSCKPWGSNGAFTPIPMFRPAGGKGPQE
jgi:hypothetical protein